jgi:hypothetical protein
MTVEPAHRARPRKDASDQDRVPSSGRKIATMPAIPRNAPDRTCPRKGFFISRRPNRMFARIREEETTAARPLAMQPSAAYTIQYAAEKRHTP